MKHIIEDFLNLYPQYNINKYIDTSIYSNKRNHLLQYIDVSMYLLILYSGYQCKKSSMIFFIVFTSQYNLLYDQ